MAVTTLLKSSGTSLATIEEASVDMKLYACEKCPLRSYSERKPKALITRIWRWHTKWCPGWKAYQKSQSEKRPE
ncbi:MAG: hypothetical protein KAY37_11480 [Phycisphaerae bacterium]|nr:hypothetical protein [Phycisphaerae bacterium]